jgi:hypothetical protein
MSLNYDKHAVEKRHNQRFLGIFLMFAVIAVIIGLFMAFSVTSQITGHNIFNDFFGISPKPANAGTSSGGTTAQTLLIGSINYATNCTDTDGGINPFLKGTCSGKNGVFNDTCNETNQSLVKEYYCAKDQKCKSLIEDCTWFVNISTGRCIGGKCELRGEVTQGVNALMTDLIYGKQILESQTSDMAAINSGNNPDLFLPKNWGACYCPASNADTDNCVGAPWNVCDGTDGGSSSCFKNNVEFRCKHGLLWWIYVPLDW